MLLIYKGDWCWQYQAAVLTLQVYNQPISHSESIFHLKKKIISSEVWNDLKFMKDYLYLSTQGISKFVTL